MPENRETMTPGMSAAHKALEKIGNVFFILAVLGGFGLGIATEGAPIALVWFVFFGIGSLVFLAGASGVKSAALESKKEQDA
jgi:hypothetical protein